MSSDPGIRIHIEGGTNAYSIDTIHYLEYLQHASSSASVPQLRLQVLKI